MVLKLLDLKGMIDRFFDELWVVGWPFDDL